MPKSIRPSSPVTQRSITVPFWEADAVGAPVSPIATSKPAFGLGGMFEVARTPATLASPHCHSEERSDEESALVFETRNFETLKLGF